MNDFNRFDLMIEALTELAREEQADQNAPAARVPTLSTILTDISPLPHEALFLGLAEDGLPVLLNLYDPVPGPILIAGDQASGKTNLLKMIARAVELLHSPSEVQYGVITSKPEEWINLQAGPNNTGIYTTQEEATQELLQSLVNWAHTNKGSDSTFLLLVDDLEKLTELDPRSEQNLRWLFLRGTSRRIWPIVTLDAGNAKNVEAWLDFFRTRLFGYIQNQTGEYLIANFTEETLNSLIPGLQFAMREGQNWLKFWIPAVD